MTCLAISHHGSRGVKEPLLALGKVKEFERTFTEIVSEWPNNKIYEQENEAILMTLAMGWDETSKVDMMDVRCKLVLLHKFLLHLIYHFS